LSEREVPLTWQGDESAQSYLYFYLEKRMHSVYALQYHFIQVVRYRRQIFMDRLLISSNK
ncbi:MAG: hypothetical protein QXI46_04080, partial [Thermoplasmata archaeon]